MIEVQLLKIQAYSFKFLDRKLINNIIIFYNDKDNSELDCKSMVYDEVISYFPDYLKSKVKVISADMIGLVFTHSDWFLQQASKILISKIIETNYYVVMDAKNHFIKEIGYEYFFSEEGFPIYNLQNHEGMMLNYYNNCLEYFSVSDPFAGNFKFQTVTPFIFKTSSQFLPLLLTAAASKQKTRAQTKAPGTYRHIYNNISHNGGQ
jgi:hypothetical protein